MAQHHETHRASLPTSPMKPRLRICLVSAAYRPYPSGVSEHVHHLAEGLRDLGQDVSILTTSFSGFGETRTSLPVTRFGRALLVPMNRSYATVPVGLRISGQVKRFLADGGFDIVHCHGMFWPRASSVRSSGNSSPKSTAASPYPDVRARPPSRTFPASFG
jgi:hypothetical protein